MKPTLAACITPRVTATIRKQLEQFSEAELIEIILQLPQRAAELEEQIKRLTEPPEDCTNSLVPPAKSRKANRSN